MDLLLDVARATVLVVIASIPLAISGWAFLDAARRPAWAWSLAGRNRVGWLVAILFGVAVLVGGLIVSPWYLWRIRPEIAAAEEGRVG